MMLSQAIDQVKAAEAVGRVVAVKMSANTLYSLVREQGLPFAPRTLKGYPIQLDAAAAPVVEPVFAP